MPTMVHIQPRGWVVILCSLWLGLQACAITGPPYPTPLPQTPDDDDRCPSPEVTLIEGQPRGLRLRLSIPSDDTNDDSESNSPTRNNPEGNRSKDPKKGDSEGNSSQNNPKTNSSSKHRSPKRGDAPCSPLGDQVALLRQVTRIDGSSTVFEPHATFKRDDAQSKALWTTGHLDILDGPLKPGFTYRYAAVGLDDEGTMVGKPSSPVGLTWVEAPEPPTALVADSVGHHMHLTWPPEASQTPSPGVLIFRRELGRSPYQRASPVLDPGTTVFIDAHLTPGAIYGYVLSAVTFAGSIPIFGPPSAETVVEAMPAPAQAPPPDAPPDVP